MDGWALTLLTPHNVGYASTCQTIGTSTGFFTSFTVFLALQVGRAGHNCVGRCMCGYGCVGGCGCGCASAPAFLCGCGCN